MDIHAPPGTGINSDSAEERIKARQERIKARLLRRKNKQEGKSSFFAVAVCQAAHVHARADCAGVVKRHER